MLFAQSQKSRCYCLLSKSPVALPFQRVGKVPKVTSRDSAVIIHHTVNSTWRIPLVTEPNHGRGCVFLSWTIVADRRTYLVAFGSEIAITIEVVDDLFVLDPVSTRLRCVCDSKDDDLLITLNYWPLKIGLSANCLWNKISHYFLFLI